MLTWRDGIKCLNYRSRPLVLAFVSPFLRAQMLWFSCADFGSGTDSGPALFPGETSCIYLLWAGCHITLLGIATPSIRACRGFSSTYHTLPCLYIYWLHLAVGFVLDPIISCQPIDFIRIKIGSDILVGTSSYYTRSSVILNCLDSNHSCSAGSIETTREPNSSSFQ